MGLRINTNLAMMVSRTYLATSREGTRQSFARLSSGLRITRASDDPSGLGVSEKMRSMIRSFDQAARNAQDGSSLAQTGESALGEVSELLGRMRELSVQAANGTLSSADRSNLDSEFQSLASEVDRISGDTELNGTSLLDGSSASVDVQAGVGSTGVIAVGLADMRSATLGIDSLDVTNSTLASNALSAIDSAITSVNAARGSFGASQNALVSRHSTLQGSSIDLAAAESRLRDADYAQETARLSQQLILTQSGTAVLAQANSQAGQALRLL